MAPPYQRGYSFSGYQANQPRSPLPGQRVDIELDNIAGVLAALDVATQSLRPIPARSLLVNTANAPAYPGPVTIEDFKALIGINGLQPALGFTPENVARRGQPNGYAPLGADSKVPAANLPPVDTTGLQPALGFTPENRANRGVANGYAPLGADAKVPLANLPDLGGGSGGSIMASQIMDASASGRSVLTGTPAQGRTALGIAFGATAGTYVEGNDARLSTVSNPVFDRAVTGGHSRTFTDIVADRVNILEWITPAQLAGNIDVGPQLRACADYCRSSGRNIMYAPTIPGSLLLNSTVDLGGVQIVGDGTKVGGGCRFICTADVTMFYSAVHRAAVRGLEIYHNGNGVVVDFPRSDGLQIRDNYIRAANSSATQPVIRMGGSNTYIDFNAIDNFRTGAYSIDSLRTTTDVSINNRIGWNYFGGPGKGIHIASQGNDGSGNPIPRQEGLDIIGNQNILTGGAFIELESILNLRVTDNMIDQCHADGAIIFKAQGTANSLGIYGVTIVGNYISPPQASATATAIRHIPTANYVIGVTVTGNEIGYAREAAFFGANASVITFTGNFIHDLASGVAVRCSSAAIAREITWGSDNQVRIAQPLVVDGINVIGGFRAITTIQAATSDGSWESNGFNGLSRYVIIPHGLAITPAKEHIFLQAFPITIAADALAAQVINVDTTNITARITTFGLAQQGVVGLSARAWISAGNA